MSTVYYLHQEPCPTCGRDDRLEVGNHGAGWVFQLRAYGDRGLTTWRAWKEYLRSVSGEVTAHSGGVRMITVEQLIEIVESRDKTLLSPADTDPVLWVRDPDGYTIHRSLK